MQSKCLNFVLETAVHKCALAVARTVERAQFTVSNHTT